MEIDPTQIAGRDRYKLLAASVVPRPIAVVSTVSPAGKPNVAPFSFFNAIGSNPMTLMFCPANASDGSEKDTLRNAKPEPEGGTGEFVVNIATESYATGMAATAESLPYEANEFELAGLTQAPSHVVAPPRLAESPISFECRTLQVLRLNPGVGGGSNVVIGEVVWVHVRDDLVGERMHIDTRKLAAIGRLGGVSYCRTREIFEMPMGRAALEGGDPFAAD